MSLSVDVLDSLQNQFFFPTGKKLFDFIQTQGTRMIFDSIDKLINLEKFNSLCKNQIPIHRYLPTPDIDNFLYRRDKPNYLTHFCNIPEKSFFKKDEKTFVHDPFVPQDLEEKIKKKCCLKKLLSVSIFLQKVSINKKLNSSFDDKESNDYLIFTDLQDKSAVAWNEKKPFHHCTFDYYNRRIHCECTGGLNHWITLDEILHDHFHKNNHNLKQNKYRILYENQKFDSNYFIPWRNLNGDFVFEQDVTTGNCIDSNVKCGSIRISDFNGVKGLSADFVFFLVDEIFYCPFGSPSQGPHICHKIMCDTFLRGGFSICSLTGIALEDKKSDWRMNTKAIERNSYEESIFNDIRDCKKAFSNKPKHVNSGASKKDINDVDHEIHHRAMSDIQTYESLRNFADSYRNKSSNRSANEKDFRKKLKNKLISLGTPESIHMASTGHFSNIKEYQREALICVRSVLQFGDCVLRAMLIDMEKTVNINNYLTFSQNSNGKTSGPKKKITLVIQDHHISRGSVIPSNFNRIEYKPTSTTSSSNVKNQLIPLQQNNLSQRIIQREIVESRMFEIEKVTIEESDVQKNIEDRIQKFADAAIRFWALIRTRTNLGRTNANFFSFNIFVYAFLYLQRDGFTINTGFAGMGERIIFFEKDLFLKNALPKRMEDLQKKNLVRNSRKGINFVYENIKKAIRETVVDEKRSFIDLHPYRNTKLDFSIDSKEFPPSLFVSLQIKKL